MSSNGAKEERGDTPMVAVNLLPDAGRQREARERRERKIWTAVLAGMCVVIVGLVVAVIAVGSTNRDDRTELTTTQIEEILEGDDGVYSFFSGLEANSPGDYAENASRYLEQMLVIAESVEEQNQIRLEYAWASNGAMLNREVIEVLSEIDVDSLSESQMAMYYTQLGVAYRCLDDFEQGGYYLEVAQQYVNEYDFYTGEYDEEY